jgi:sugar O-acyltransferase (sialic acid O-acetyltransferase NeuD family)
MSELFPVLVPLVNTNESDSVLADLPVKEGQHVKKGALLAVFETTKSTFELTAERDGYVLGLMQKDGATMRAGDLLCYLSDSADAPLPVAEEQSNEPQTGDSLPDGLRITQPALALAREMGVDLGQLPSDALITEKLLQEMFSASSKKIDPTLLVIFGGGGHAKALIELIEAEGKYKVAGILDDHLPVDGKVLGFPVLGGRDMLTRLKARGIGQVVNAVGGIGDITPRLRIYEAIRAAGLKVPTVIHPRAFIEKSAVMEPGQQVFFNAYIGTDVMVGFGCILNTGIIVSHDCILGDYVNLSPGAILAGAVQVGERVLVGMGVTINLGVKIGAGARIGNSAVVKADVPENGIVRAGEIWPPAV